MTKDQINQALDWLYENHATALKAKDTSLANAIYDKIQSLNHDLIQIKRDEEDQERDWGMEWYDTRWELE
jgi:uncharacterized protein (DUF305 family)